MTVRATDEQYERALDILDDEGTVDIEERAASWRSEGWTGTAILTTAEAPLAHCQPVQSAPRLRRPQVLEQAEPLPPALM